MMPEEFYQDGLRIELRGGPRLFLLLWTGVNDSRDSAPLLNAFLDRIVERVAGNEISIDFRRVEYMNSSASKPILNLVKRLDVQSTRTRIIYDHQQTFQRTTFAAFRTLSRTLKNLTVEARER